jgi:hypothetical protein
MFQAAHVKCSTVTTICVIVFSVSWHFDVVCVKKQRICAKSCFKLGKAAAESNRMLCHVYGNEVLTRRDHQTSFWDFNENGINGKQMENKETVVSPFHPLELTFRNISFKSFPFAMCTV